MGLAGVERVYWWISMSNLVWARRYAALGWRVFPVYSMLENGECSCGKVGCRDAGKHPRTPRGCKNATTDESWLCTWWLEKFPDASIGLATGAGSGVWVLDVDERGDKSGGQELADLCAGRELPETPLAVTGSGGGSHHLFFTWDPDRPMKNLARRESGLDVRGEGGYVILPPSNHASGNLYEWDFPPDLPEMSGQAVAPAPDWLIDALRVPARLPDSRSSTRGVIASEPLAAGTPVPGPPGLTFARDLTGNRGGVVLDSVGEASYPVAAPTHSDRVDEVREALLHVEPDLGYEDWVKVGMGIHDEFGGSEEGFGLFVDWSSRGSKFGGDADCRKHWASFAGGRGRTIKTVFGIAAESPAYRAALRERGRHLQLVKRGTTATPGTSPLSQEIPILSQEIPIEEPEILWPSDLMALRPPPALIHQILNRGELAMIYGAPGSGKSFVALSMAIAVASGRPWFELPTKPGVVLYGALEGLVGMRKRLLAAWDGDPAELDGRLAFTEGIRLSDPARLNWIRRKIEEMEEKPALIVVDTLSRAIPGVDENQARDVTEIVERCRGLQRDYEVAVALVHHTRKAGDSERGSTVMAGAVEAKIRVLKTPGERRPQVHVVGEKAKDDAEFEGISLELETIQLGQLPPDDFGNPQSSCRLIRPETDAESFAAINAMTRDPARKAQIVAVLEVLEPFSELEAITFSQLLEEVALRGVLRSTLQRIVRDLEGADLIRTEVKGSRRYVWPTPKLGLEERFPEEE